MGLASLVSYLSGALAYALLGALVVCAALRLGGIGLQAGRIALVLSTAFVISLAVSPFPDPAHLDCSGGGMPLQLVPFAYVEAPVRLWTTDAPLRAWLTDRTLTSTIMNVVFFTLVGAALGTLTMRLRWAALYGLGLTIFIEVTQVTGIYGIYPCRYRTFDVDDLMTNVLGVVLGALAVWWLRPRPSARS